MALKHILASLLCLPLAACGAASEAQPDASAAPAEKTAEKPAKAAATATPDISIDPLGGGFYRLVGPGGNIGVSVGDDGIFVIDDKFDRFADQILAQLKTLSGKPLSYVINTHYHGDHTGANGAMKTAGATIVAHDNVRTRMGITFDNKLWGRPVEATAPHQWPTVTFSDEATYHFNGQTAKIMHVPAAHTDGDSIVYFKEANILHMGDNYFKSIFPYVDVDSGGSLQGMIAAQSKAIDMIDENTQVIPGHGDMSTKAELIQSRDRLQDIFDRVNNRIIAGDDLDTIIAGKPLSDLAKFNGFIKEDMMIRIAYRSIKER